MKKLPATSKTISAAFSIGVFAMTVLAGIGLLYPRLPGDDNFQLGADLLSWPANWISTRPAHAQSTAKTDGLQALATGAMAAFKATSPPEPFAAVEIVDTAGKPRPMTQWQGRVVLLNLWATWCAPCLKELPALDKLKAELGGADFDVVALNIDKAPEKPQKFLADNAIKALEFLRDPTTKAFAAVKSQGMPTTLLLDRQGREIGRLVGPAEWDSTDAKALMKAAIAAR